MNASKRRDIPLFDQPLIETHCHLDYLPAEELEAVLQRSFAVGIERLLTIAVSPDNLQVVRDIAARYPQVWCTQGVHPHEAQHFDDTVAADIRAGCADPRVLAVGEIGLDYHYDHSPREQQRRTFAQQLEIAAAAELPVVIHTREADADTQAILAEYLPQLPRRGVIHSFSSGPALAEFCLEAGFLLGFNGMVTFRRAENVRAVVAATPLEQLLLETDAPYLTPVPWRGHRNAPFYLPFVAEKIAAVKALTIDDLLRAARANSERLFRFPAGAAA